MDIDHGLRCEVTGNPCGTDTWRVGHECPCPQCQRYLYPYRHHGPSVFGDKLTDFLISEANMRSRGLLPDDE